jgi:amino acid transporter
MSPSAAPPAHLRKLRLLPLIAATYFMVAGGPFGLEDIIGRAGYSLALLILLIVPFLWSLPTALMIGELASAIPAEGGFYVWVRRALGPFWGFQEAWLSLAASVFDMAIYPRIFVDYLTRLAPALTSGHRALLWSLAIVLLCALWNLRGAHAVGTGSVWFFALLLAPFAVMVFLGLRQGIVAHSLGLLTQRAPAADLTGAILFALWNYMGWDNASTIAQEVEHPQRNYPRAMLAAAALVAASYVLPLAAVALARIPAAQFSSGAWTDAARTLGGPFLALAVVAGGAITGVSMFNALSMSYARLPYAMAADRLLPRAFTRRLPNGAPWLAILACSAAWALALQFSFLRLITMDLVLYGLSLILEFIALIVLRLRAPAMHRPFRVPGGLAATILVGAAPTALIVYAIYASRAERFASLPAWSFASLIAAAGVLVYFAAARANRAPASALR